MNLRSDALRLDALVALSYQGEPLEEGHGGPVRMLVPGRYFYKSVKWLERIEVRGSERIVRSDGRRIVS